MRLDVVPRYELLHLNESQREELTRWAHSRTLPAGDVFRAMLILSLADGMTYEQVVSALATTKPTIARWKARFEQAGIAGLDRRSPRAVRCPDDVK